MLGRTLKLRKGLILRLYDQTGTFAEGEISPMPLMHEESLLIAENQLKKLLSKSFLQNPDFIKSLPPSVRFGFEMAWRKLFKKFDLEEKISPRAEVTIKGESAKNKIASKQIPVNALVTGSGDDLRYQCEQIKLDGFRAVKIKVGQFKVDKDLKRLEIAKKIFGNQINELTNNSSQKNDDQMDNSIVSRLKQLKTLLDMQIIDKKEFEIKKTEIMKDL